MRYWCDLLISCHVSESAWSIISKSWWLRLWSGLSVLFVMSANKFLKLALIFPLLGWCVSIPIKAWCLWFISRSVSFGRAGWVSIEALVSFESFDERAFTFFVLKFSSIFYDLWKFLTLNFYNSIRIFVKNFLCNSLKNRILVNISIQFFFSCI